MESKYSDFESKQFHDQANLVYLGGCYTYSLIIPVMIYIGIPSLIILHIVSFFLHVLVYVLNRKRHYSMASLIFISMNLILAFVNTLVLGFETGFVFYFFNIASLTVFTRWEKKYKLLGIGVEIGLLILLFFSAQRIEPWVELQPPLLYGVVIANIILNMMGVFVSSYYFLEIATQYREEMFKQATTDQLTQLSNRHAFSQFLATMSTKTSLIHNNMGVLMMDIDHFKKVNDTYGHQCGDRVLIGVADIIRKNDTGYYLAARYGGEEFIIVLPVDNTKVLSDLAENIRSMMENYQFDCDQNQFAVTLSIGCAFVKVNTPVDFDTVVKFADNLLYQSKSNGRNQVTCNLYQGD